MLRLCWPSQLYVAFAFMSLGSTKTDAKGQQSDRGRQPVPLLLAD
jgi:hypothetical protein